jgi:hypothetical protein
MKYTNPRTRRNLGRYGLGPDVVVQGMKQGLQKLALTGRGLLPAHQS